MLAGFRSRCAMPFLVRRAESARDRDRDLHRLAHRQRALAQAVGERFAVQEFRDDEDLVPFAPDVVNREDVGVGERGHGARLALEAGAPVGVVCHVGRQHLQRHVAPQPRIARPVDLAHAAGPERGEHFVRTKPAS